MVAKMRKTSSWLAWAAIVLLPALAYAAPGDGLRSGNLQLNPGIKFGAGYDSNLYYESLNRPENVRTASQGLIEPRLKIGVIEASSYDFSLDGTVGWTQYLTTTDSIRNQSGLSSTLLVTGTLNPQGAVSLKATERFVRTNETTSAASSAPLNRTTNVLGATVGLHPGGRVIESHLSYDYGVHRLNLYPDLDRNEHLLSWKNQWRFLPKTGFVLDANYRVIRYREPARGGSAVRPDGRLVNANSTPVRVQGGVSGLITNRLSLRLTGGYGWGLYEAGPTIEGPLAHVEGTYVFGPQALRNRFRVGYELNFSDSIIGNYFSFHRFYTNYEQGFYNNRLRVALGGNVQFRNYARLDVRTITTEDVVITLPEEASDLLVGVNGSLGYHFSNAWSAGVQYGLGSNFTDDLIEIDGPGESAVRDYLRHHVMVSTTLTY